jgi:diguanylate cyclase (GGDEF)-like protein/PAS domain S-box-containing protein
MSASLRTPPRGSAAIAGSLPVAAIECTFEGEVLAANELALELFGLAPDEIVGASIERCLSLQLALDEIAGADAAPRRRVDLEGRRSNGVPFFARVDLGAIGSGASRRVLCLVSKVDRAELVAAAQRYFDAAFDSAPIGMALFNPDGEYVRVNRAMCEILGRSEAEVLGRRDQEFTHPEDREADVEAAWRILEGDLDTHQCEKRLIRRGGSIAWVLVSLTFLRDDAGRPLSWVAQIQDITARRQAEEALRRQRDLSDAVIASMNDGFALTRDGEIVMVNDALCRVTGFAREELLGARPPYPYWPPERREEAVAAREHILDHSGGELELVLMRKDGERFHAWLTAAAVAGPDGTRLGFANTIRDISDRKRHERDLERKASSDGLTGLLNRAAFMARLREEIAGAHDTNQPLSLVLMDIDRFKAINDRHGHPVGDGVLVEIAKALLGVSRGEDYLARIGGEEFAWLLPSTPPEAAESAAERARRAVEASVRAGLDSVTVSLGVCGLDEAGDANALYQLADAALYRAKARGRNCCVRHMPSDDQ